MSLQLPQVPQRYDLADQIQMRRLLMQADADNFKTKQQNISGGSLLFAPDNTYDIGADDATRPRNVFAANVVRALAFQINKNGGGGLNAISYSFAGSQHHVVVGDDANNQNIVFFILGGEAGRFNQAKELVLVDRLRSINVGQFDIDSLAGAATLVRINRQGGTGGFQVHAGNTTTVNFRVEDGGQVNARIEYRIAGTRVVNTRKTGWATATGTATRTTFATASVTLPQLAERVKALIDDLHSTAGHGLIGT